MKPDQLYHSLKELAEKLEIQISEQNFRKTGIPMRSGLCKVKDEIRFIMDKHLPVRNKVDILAECLAEMPHDDIYVIPAVRDLLTKYKKIFDKKNPKPDPESISDPESAITDKPSDKNNTPGF